MKSERRASIRCLVSESAANAAARPALTIGLIALIASMLAGTALAEIGATVSSRTYERNLIDVGYATLLIDQENPAGDTFSMEDCDSLAPIVGVRAAVPLREPQPSTLWTDRGPETPIRTAGSGLLDLLRGVDPAPMSNWVAAQTIIDPASLAASSTGDEYPLQLVTSDGTTHTTTALTVKLTALGAGLSGNLISIDNTPGPISACALLVDPSYRDEVFRSVDTALPALEGFAKRWALPSADRFENPQSQFERRPSQYYWLLCTAIFAALSILHLRLRRADYALYSVSGLDTRRLWTLATLELLYVSVAATVLAVAVVGVGILHAGSGALDAKVGLQALLRAALSIVLTGAIVARAVVANNSTGILDAIKDT